MMQNCVAVWIKARRKKTPEVGLSDKRKFVFVDVLEKEGEGYLETYKNENAEEFTKICQEIDDRKQINSTKNAVDTSGKIYEKNQQPDPRSFFKNFRVSDTCPAFIHDIVGSTVKYNDEPTNLQGHPMWNGQKLDPYHELLERQYRKTNNLAKDKQKYYFAYMLILAILSTLVTFLYLIYDEWSFNYMIIGCSVVLGLSILAYFLPRCKNRQYHERFMNYRAFAEAIRTQFYLTYCLGEKYPYTSVCELQSWTLKTDMVWIDKALRTFAIVAETEEQDVDLDSLKNVWVGEKIGQLDYHIGKMKRNKKKASRVKIASRVLVIAAIIVYSAILVFNVIAFFNKGFFWHGDFFDLPIPSVNMGNFAVGLLASLSLFLSSYFGKLSYDRIASDSGKMTLLYASASNRWDEAVIDKEKFKRFVFEIAREEIVENGNWYSYVNENGLEISI